MTRFGLIAVLIVWPLAVQAQGWLHEAVGDFIGRDHNDGQLQCEDVVFSLQDGALVGHYRIADDPAFEGELTDFVPDPDGDSSGLFTWTDRDGSGVRFIRWAPDFKSFVSLWGRERPDPRQTGYGLRSPEAAVPGCGGSPTS